jgi:hypothetical protein
MPKGEPKTPSSVPKENQPPGTPVAKCPKDKQITITSETVEKDLPNRARTRIGLGEVVTLTATPGPADWTIEKGMGELYPKSGASVRLTASEEAGDVVVSAEGDGCRATITFTVVAPSGVHMVRRPGTLKNHTRGTPSTGMILDIYIQPSDVSFREVRFTEREVRATGTDDFEQYCRENEVKHGANFNAASISRVDPKLGSQINGTDRAAARATAPGVGSMTWAIPWEYTVSGGLMTHLLPGTVDQVVTYAADGTATLTKGGASVDSARNDRTEKDPLFP